MPLPPPEGEDGPGPIDGPVEPAEPDPPPFPPFGGLPDPSRFDPLRQPFPPHDGGLPDMLEWKLDVMIFQQARVLNRIRLIAAVIFWAGNFGLPGIAALLAAILARLAAGFGMLQSLLTAMVFLMAFAVIRFVIPRLRRAAR